MGPSAATSLSVPPLTACTSRLHHRFLVVSENEVLHAAGNTLRISKIRSDPSRCRATDGVLSDGNYDGHGRQSIVFAEAERLRGFSCFCFNSYRKRVAYSARRPSPSILVKALCESQPQSILCEITGGASIQYQDICFSRNGSRLAAIGKGSVDSVLYVWDIEKAKETGPVKNPLSTSLTSELIATFQFDDPVLSCLFDPSNDDVVSILSGDRKSVVKCHLTKTIGQRKVIAKKITLDPEIINTKDTHITSMTWETDSQLLLGTSDGSIFLVEEAAIIPKKTVVVYTSSSQYGPVRTMNVTAVYVIVGFEKGMVAWLQRPNGTAYELNSQVCEVNLNDNILQISNTPDYKSIVVYTAGGRLCYLPIDDVKKIESGQYYSVRFPVGVVTALTSVVMTGKADVPLLVTGNTNGSVEAWRELDSRESASDLHRMFGSIDLGAPVTSIECLKGFPVCAVGLADSSIKFIHFGKAKDKASRDDNRLIDLDLVELKSEVLCSSPITHLCFNPVSNKLAVGCFHSGQLFVICTEPSNLHIIGVMEVEKEALSLMRWSETESSLLLVGSHFGVLSCFDITPLCFTHEPLKSLWTRQISDGSSVREIITGSSSIEKDDDSVICICNSTEDVEIFEVDMSQEGVGNIEKKSAVKTTLGQPTELLFDGNRIVIGTKYGSIEFIEFADGKNYQLAQNLHLHCNAVIAMCFSSDGSKLYSSGVDRSVFVQRVCDPGTVQHSSHDYDYLLPRKPRKSRIENIPSSSRRSSWIDMTRHNALRGLEEKHAKKKMEIRSTIEDITEQIRNLYEENQKLDEHDRLHTSAFAIDVEADEIRRKDVSSKLNEHREEIISTIAENRRASASLIQKHVKPMVESFYRTFELSHDPKRNVCSFPICSLTETEKRRKKYMKYLRLNEIAEIKREEMKRPTLPDSKLQREEKYVFNVDGAEKMCIQTKEERFFCEDNEEQDDLQSNNGLRSSPESLLYQPQSIRSNLQRRFQILFVREAARERAHTFNEKYLAFRSNKESVMQEIKKHIAEIKRIAEELGVDLDTKILHASQLVDIDVTPDSFLHHSSPDNMKLFSGSNSPTSNENATSVVSNNNGTYPIAEPLELKVEMSEKESTDERRQHLTNELKKLSFSVLDMIATFNLSLESLATERMAVHQKLQCCELYGILLAKTVFQSECDAYSYRQLLEELSRVKCKHEESKLRLEEIRTAHDEIKVSAREKVNKDRLMDKRFRGKIQDESDHPLDQETVNLLYQLFRRRDIASKATCSKDNIGKTRYHKKGTKSNTVSIPSSITRRSKLGRQSGRDSISQSSTARSSTTSSRKSCDNTIDTLDNEINESIWSQMKSAMAEAMVGGNEENFVSARDPFWPGEEDENAAGSGTCSATLQNVAALTVNDIPEGFNIDENVWETMQFLRKEKIMMEREVMREIKKTEEVQGYLDVAASEEQTLSERIAYLTDELKMLDNKQAERPKCAEFLVNIKQGQDEIRDEDDGEFATKYSDAIFIPSSGINQGNEVLMKLGEERLGVLDRIEASQNTINQIKWEKEILEMKHEDAKELLKDYHLLRLTPQLKKMINGEIEDPIEEERKAKDLSARRKIAHDAKMKKLKREERELRSAISKRKEDNVRLQEQLETLRETVRSKEKEFKSNETAQEKCDDKMKSIMQRSKWVEKIKRQADEISQLRNELDRLRQKTFPSFSPTVNRKLI